MAQPIRLQHLYQHVSRDLGIFNNKVVAPYPGSLSSSKPGEKDHAEKLTFAKKSCPKELELCPSSIGFKHGIRTKQVIPEGTWMGPYQGDLVKASDVTAETDTSYMWEVTKKLNNQLIKLNKWRQVQYLF